MKTKELLSRTVIWVETALAGSLSPTVRRVMHIELSMSLAYGVFYACIMPFTQVVLRRMGASVDMLALYTALLFVGSVFTSFSIVLMRRRRTINIIVFCWLLGRSLFLLTAFVTGATQLMAIGIVFWLLEAFTIPAYTRVIQKIYPESGRGKVMSTVRMGRVSVILLVTPLAGWALDRVGYQVLFPIGALFGILATYLFTRIDLDEGELPPRQTKAFSDLWQIVRGDRNFAIYLLSYSLFGLGGLLSWPLYPVVQVDRLQLSYSEIGLLGLVESLTWFFSYLLWGRTIDKRGGLFVVRAISAISIVTPLTYMSAQSLWMLLPSAIARGLGMAGFELGRISAGIQLADPERVTEYAAIQSTVVGLRGLVAPLVTVGLLRLGAPHSAVFLLSVVFLVMGWVMFGRVTAPTPGDEEYRERQRLRYRWPFRRRISRV
ncbi:MAG: MFS transporter [Caldilineaceae bacterium SB0661_bin_32]|uniref:MFS transporter n=1 Tax=Caldilineaceae bacterium SB0661_bin_32 TaxID=2605255 RepID=A0A6B1D0Z5_9CHLR|nr:MFS transporter [Caldilineaceae bacterium SB0661_bin_32]